VCADISSLTFAGHKLIRLISVKNQAVIAWILFAKKGSQKGQIDYGPKKAKLFCGIALPLS